MIARAALLWAVVARTALVTASSWDCDAWVGELALEQMPMRLRVGEGSTSCLVVGGLDPGMTYEAKAVYPGSRSANVVVRCTARVSLRRLLDVEKAGCAPGREVHLAVRVADAAPMLGPSSARMSNDVHVMLTLDPLVGGVPSSALGPLGAALALALLATAVVLRLWTRVDALARMCGRRGRT